MSALRVFRAIEEVGPDAKPTAVAIGNFDGVHAGHRALLHKTVEIAKRQGLRPSVLTFDPHPSKIVAPERAPRLLNTTEQRWEFMKQEGIEQIFVLSFDRQFAALGPEDFVRQVLREGLRAKAVLVGENFRFGAKQAGNVSLLRALGENLGFSVETAPIVSVRGRSVSSTEIRNLLDAGSVSLACRLLGRPYWVEGTIVSGHGIGSKQTVPTLNLMTEAEVLPADGVYITRTTDSTDGHSWHSITNIGMRPTFDGTQRTIETYLLSPFDGETPERIRLEFLRRVREERKFESPEALKAQILRDVNRAYTYFRRRKV